MTLDSCLGDQSGVFLLAQLSKRDLYPVANGSGYGQGPPEWL